MIPENIVIAVLYKTKKGLRFEEDALGKVLNDRSEQSLFEAFRWHNHYHYSRRLLDVITVLQWGGLLCCEMTDTIRYFPTQDRIQGPYGKSIYDKFLDEEKKLIDEAAIALAATPRWHPQIGPVKTDL
jgi:hypothetical protein